MPDPNLPPETDPVPPAANQPEQPPAPPADPKPEETVDFWKQKFADSSREANLLREAEAARKKAEQESTKDPTDSELRTAFPSWDLMSDTEKDLARRTFAAERTAGTAVRSLDEIKSERSQATSIELAIAANTALQGKEQAFRQFASRPQYKNVPMEVLVPAFLQTQSTAPAAPAAPPTTPRPGLEPGNGGPRTPDKPKTLTADELKALRTTDQKAYETYIKTHDIDIDLGA